MKQKRSKSELNQLDAKMQNQSSTRAGGNVDRSVKSTGKDSDCASGVCAVVWKPDLLKR